MDKKHERKEGLTAVEIEQEKSASARSRAEVTSRWSPVISTQQYLQGKALSLPYRSEFLRRNTYFSADLEKIFVELQ